MSADRDVADSIEVAYTDGVVLPGSGAPSAEAVLVREGRIAAVGTTQDVLEAAGPDAERCSLDGAVVIPGLIDTHPHLMHFAAFFAPAVDLTGAGSHDDIVTAIRAKAAETPAREWIIATPVGEPHYFRRRSWRDLAEGTLPDRHVLDRATGDHPVFIQAWAPTTPNVCAANSAALTALGLDRSTPDRVSNVWIEKDDQGEPTGILSGDVTIYYNSDPFFAELMDRMPPIIRTDLVAEATVRAMAAHNALGYTTVFEAHAMEPEMIGLYGALRERGLLSLRVQASPELEGNALPQDHPKSMDEIRATLEAALANRDVSDDWLRVDGITTCAYGPAGCGRMRWDAGYTDPWGDRTTGRRQVSEEKIRYAIDFCAERGLRLNLLSCSPDEHDEYMDLAATALRTHGLERTGWLMEHGYVMRPDQPKRLAELGFDLTVSTSFTSGKGEMLAERIGPDALAWLNPLRAMLDGGLTVAASTDWWPLNPFELMALAVTHEMFPGGRSNAGPHQAITRAEAFEMWTSGGASVLRWDGIGALQVGAHADLVVVDRNPITCELGALPGTQVLRTVVGGRVVYDSGALTATPKSASTS